MACLFTESQDDVYVRRFPEVNSGALGGSLRTEVMTRSGRGTAESCSIGERAAEWWPCLSKQIQPSDPVLLTFCLADHIVKAAACSMTWPWTADSF